jgi:hypothetical protein
MISSEYENIISIEVINSLSSINLRNLIVYDFNVDGLGELFYNNPNYMESQISNSSIIKKANKKVKFILINVYLRQMKNIYSLIRLKLKIMK